MWRERCCRDHGDGDEKVESKDLPSGEEEGAEALRVRLDTVGAVVLVDEAREVGQRPEVAAGVSRCVVPSIFPFLRINWPA